VQVIGAIQALLNDGTVQLRTMAADGQKVRVGLSSRVEIAERNRWVLCLLSLTLLAALGVALSLCS
jgi:hypothetical protein